jgi:hypothetical protein
MKLKTILMVPLVVGLVAYGGIKGYVYVKAKQELDQVIATAGPFVDISYEGIGSSLDGTLSVEGVKLSPREVVGSIRIQSLDISGDGPGFFYEMFNGFDPGQPPRKFQVAARKISIPVDANFMAQLADGSAAPRPGACSLGGVLQHVGLDRLGYDQLTADGRIGYQLDAADGEMTLRMDYLLRGVEELFMEMSFSGMPDPGQMMMGAGPRLNRMSLQYRLDPDYLKGMLNHCAAEGKQSREQFVESLFQKDEDYYARNLGFVPGGGILFALQELIGGSGELLITASPGPQFNPMTMAGYSTEQVVSMLGLDVTVGGKPVTDFSFQTPSHPHQSSTLMALLGSDEAQEETWEPDSEEQRAPVRRAPIRYRFVSTPVTALQQYTGREVRLTVKGVAKVQEGMLLSVGDGYLNLEKAVFNGKMTSHLPLSKISRVEVYLPQTPPDRP